MAVHVVGDVYTDLNLYRMAPLEPIKANPWNEPVSVHLLSQRVKTLVRSLSLTGSNAIEWTMLVGYVYMLFLLRPGDP